MFFQVFFMFLLMSIDMWTPARLVLLQLQFLWQKSHEITCSVNRFGCINWRRAEWTHHRSQGHVAGLGHCPSVLSQKKQFHLFASLIQYVQNPCVPCRISRNILWKAQSEDCGFCQFCSQNLSSFRLPVTGMLVDSPFPSATSHGMRLCPTSASAPMTESWTFGGRQRPKSQSPKAFG